MNTTLCSPQSQYVFGPRVKDWLSLPREDWQALQIPDHLEDQLFHISFSRTPAAHYFELQVSEQCPRDTYARLAKCVARLGIECVVIAVVHARGAGVHLIFWRKENSSIYHHLDIDPSRPSSFDSEVMSNLQRPAPRRIRRLFELMDGQNLSQSFFVTLRNHLAQVPCRNETAYYALVDLVLKLIFLIFVQRKRWLNFDPNYLESKMMYCEVRGLSAVTCFLKPLFAAMEGLHVRSDFPLGELPHLGGGLFVFQGEDLPRVENTWLLTLYRTLVSRYSFSLFEAREGRKILGISPEILGHVFENLLLGRDRKDQGTFYTPLHVAEKQVRSAIDSWRTHHCPNPAKWSDVLPTLRLLDPSCGSGTYLVAAFNELVRQRLAFLPICERYNGRLFRLKKEVVLNNLYGVDIHPMAVKLAEVRLWLNMIQDLEISQPSEAPALPNLKHHLRPGDFLSSHLQASPKRIKAWPKYGKLEAVRRRFPNSSPRSRPVVLRQMYRLERELEQWLQARTLEDAQDTVKTELSQQMLPGHERDLTRMKMERTPPPPPILHIVFSRVFLEGGFHLVVGNPPWLRAAGLSKKQKEAILANLDAPKGLTLDGQVDLSLYFVSACLNLLKQGGHLSFLLPGKIATCRYAHNMRQWLAQHTTVDYLFDYGIDQKLLFDADTFPLALGVTHQKPEKGHMVTIERYGKDVEEQYTLPQSRLRDVRGVWTIQPPTTDERMYQWPRLGDADHRIQRGVVTGAKRHFTFEQPPEIPKGIKVRPLLRGRDIQAGSVEPGHYIYWPFDNGPFWYRELAPDEHQWLENTGQLMGDATRLRLKYRPKQVGPWVLIWKYLSRGWQVALMQVQKWIPDQTTYYMNFGTFELAYRYYAWFHTEAANQWLEAFADRGKSRHFFYYAHTVASLPIPPDLETRPMQVPSPRNLMPGEGRGRWQA